MRRFQMHSGVRIADAPGHQALKDRDAVKAELDKLEMEWLELEEKKAEA